MFQVTCLDQPERVDPTVRSQMQMQRLRKSRCQQPSGCAQITLLWFMQSFVRFAHLPLCHPHVRVPVAWRDSCAGLLITLNECRKKQCVPRPKHFVAPSCSFIDLNGLTLFKMVHAMGMRARATRLRSLPVQRVRLPSIVEQTRFHGTRRFVCSPVSH